MTIKASKQKSAFEDGCLKHRTSRRSHAKLVGCVTKSSHATQAERTRANKFTGTIKPIRQQNLSTSWANSSYSPDPFLDSNHWLQATTDGSEGGCGATDINMLSEGDDSDGSCIMDGRWHIVAERLDWLGLWSNEWSPSIWIYRGAGQVEHLTVYHIYTWSSYELYIKSYALHGLCIDFIYKKCEDMFSWMAGKFYISSTCFTFSSHFWYIFSTFLLHYPYIIYKLCM